MMEELLGFPNRNCILSLYVAILGVTSVQKNLYNTKKSKLTIFVEFDKQMLGEPFYR